MNKMPRHELDSWGLTPVRGNDFCFRQHIQTGSGDEGLRPRSTGKIVTQEPNAHDLRWSSDKVSAPKINKTIRNHSSL
jgi:hypothetical protein